jgi:xanthine/uracil permease
LVVASVVTLGVFVEMDRSPTLSAIGGTEAGKVRFDRHFVLNILTYGLVLVLGLVVSQFPQIGRFVGAWFNPLLRIVGAG